MKFESCGKLEALKDLAEVYNYRIDTPNRPNSAPPPPPSPHASIFDAAANYYAHVLHNTPWAMEYQQAKRCHAPQTLHDFRVGFTDGNLLQALQGQKFSMEQIVGSGLVKEDKSSGYKDYFVREVFIYPYLDAEGRVYDFFIKDPKGKYNYRLMKSHRGNGGPFYNEKALTNDEIVIVEGANDLLTLNDARITNAVATTGQLTANQLKFLKDRVKTGKIKRITTCFDNDKAGTGYRKRIENELSEFCYSDRQVTISERLRTADFMEKKESQDDEPVLNEIPKLTKLVLDAVVFDRNANDIDDYLRTAPDPAVEFKRLLGQTKRYLKPLNKIIPAIRSWYKICDIKNTANEIGEVVFDYFNALGNFFVQGEDCRFFYRNTIYDIGNNIAFKSLLYHAAGQFTIRCRYSGRYGKIENADSRQSGV